MNDWVPLLQTLMWVGLAMYVAYRFSDQLQAFLSTIHDRVASGSSLKAGPVELGASDFDALEKVAISDPSQAQHEDDWSKERNAIYHHNHGLFLAHIIEPPAVPDDNYDIFIYLVRHKSEVFDDIEYAEFFLGSHWGNKVFKEDSANSLMGVTTSAPGPFLCTCRIRLKDGTEVRTSRYIDFEMARVFESNGH